MAQRPGQPAQPKGPFGEALAAYRGGQREGKPFGITREELAREWGFSVNTVHKWEQGEALPSPLAAGRIRQVAAAFVWPSQRSLDTFARKLAARRATKRSIRVVGISCKPASVS